MVTSVRAELSGFNLQQRLGFPVLTIAYRPALEPTHPPIQWAPGAKRPVCEADLSPPCLVPRSRMHGSIPALPKFIFVAWCLIKQWIQI
jgi:hypothetical protein